MTELSRELLLSELREGLNITQVEMAEKLQTKQANVSRTERRKNIKLSTLKRYVEALGGELDVFAKFDSCRVRINLKGLD